MARSAEQVRPAIRLIPPAISLATMITLRCWPDLLGSSPRTFFYPCPLGAPACLGLAWATLIIALCCFGIMALHERWPGPALSRVALVVLIVLGLSGLGRGLNLDPLRVFLSRYPGWLVRAAVALAALAAFSFSFQHTRRVYPVFKGFLWIFLALGPILWFSAARAFWTARPIAGEPAPARAGRAPGTTWVLVFDEMDYRTIFQDRPASLAMPVMDSLAAGGIFAPNCLSPTSETSSAIATLLRGETVIRLLVRGFARATLMHRNGALEGWGGENTLFSDWKRDGGSTTVVGWYYPYGPLCGRDVDQVFPFEFMTSFRRLSYLSTGAALAAHLKEAVTLPGLSFWRQPPYDSGEQLATYRALEARLEAVMAERRNDLVYVHMPIPHFPALPAARGRYVGNMREVDAFLGRFRATLQRSGRWSGDTVLILADHGLRNTPYYKGTPWLDEVDAFTREWDFRVPFILKLPGQTRGLRHDGPFDLAYVRKLLVYLHGHPQAGPADVSAAMTAIADQSSGG